ncbi:MAG: hypothetical protein AAF823_02195 [Planctomycetota bacterium]
MFGASTGRRSAAVSPAWLGRVRSGLGLLFVASVVAIAASLVMNSVFARIHFWGAREAVGGLAWWDRALSALNFVIIRVGCGSLLVWAVFRATVTEGGPGIERLRRAALVARWAAALGLGLVVFFGLPGVLSVLVGGAFVLPRWWSGVHLAVMQVEVVVQAFEHWGLLAFASGVLAVAGAARLAQQAKWVAVGVLVLGVLLGGVQLVQQLGVGSSARVKLGSVSMAERASGGEALEAADERLEESVDPEAGALVERTRIYADGSVWWRQERVGEDGGRLLWSEQVTGTGAVAPPMPERPVLRAVQSFVGLGVGVCVIWGLVLLILLYRRLGWAVRRAADREWAEASAGSVLVEGGVG